MPETTFRLSEDTYLEPDVIIYPRTSGLRGLTGANVLLVVEIADSSLRYDVGRKAALYASFGIRELWVIDAVRLTTRIFREPAVDGYRDVSDFGPTDQLSPLIAPAAFAAEARRAGPELSPSLLPHACFLSFTTLCSVCSAVSKKRRTPRAAWRMRCSFSTSASRT